MGQLKIVPMQEKYFNPDWSRVAIVSENCFEMYLSANLSLVFTELIDHSKMENFSLWTYIEKSSNFDITSMKRRIQVFNKHRKDRLERLFSKKERPLLFFDNEECGVLRELFNTMSFSATVSISYNNQNYYDLSKLPENILRMVVREAANIGCFYTLEPGEYRDWVKRRQVKKITTIKQWTREVKIMNKSEAIGRIIVGSTILTVGTLVASVGFLNIYKGLRFFGGAAEEVILVESD